MPLTRGFFVAGAILAGLAAALPPLGVSGCGPTPSTGTGGGPMGPMGGGGGGDSGSPGADGGGGGSVSGSNCTIQTTSGVMLCEGISRCPSLTVSQNAFTQCGFLIGGTTIDIVCECSGYLCSAGATPTCAAAATVLMQQSSNEVCAQLSSGGCAIEGLGGGSGTGSSACSTTCESSCNGDPNCIQACGC
jgi:hypothetical protein